MSLPSNAEVPGQSDPAFAEAIDFWLSGNDDLAALRRLAELAREGQVAAQLSLALIERDPTLHSHVTRKLDRKARAEIFRAPADGPFGTPWFRVAAEHSDYARARTLPLLEENLDTVQAAAMKADDLRLAWVVAQTGYNFSGKVEALTRYIHPALLPHSLSMLTELVPKLVKTPYLDKFTPEQITAYRAVLDAMKSVDLSQMPPHRFSLRTAQPVWEMDPAILRSYGQTLLENPRMAFAAEVIRAACPEETAWHMGLAGAVISALPISLLQESPLAPIVTTEEWQNAPRAPDAFLRSLTTQPQVWFETNASCLLPDRR